MEKKTSSKENKQGINNIASKIVSAILILFTILCIIIIFKDKNYIFIPSVVGIIFLVITINVANIVKVDKNNAKTFTIASIIMDVISIPLLFNYVIFAYALAIPAFIISSKSKKITNDQLTLKSFILSTILIVICIVASVVRYIILLNN